MSTQEPLSLEGFGEAYQVIGELSGRPGARTVMATRRDDGAPVLIMVTRTPDGDEGNALSHLAADANLLSGAAHRNLLPVVEGKWLGTDAFALVTERGTMPTLEDMLSRREEQFDFPRIAAILQQVNMLLEWARARKVVHRTVTPQTLFVEPGSDRVLALFTISPLPRSGIPGAEADARVIAGLARAMMTRSPAAPERAELPLLELRPGLPISVASETEALLGPPGTAPATTDLSAYIARIAMADALKSGEVYLAESLAAIAEQERVHREQIETERHEHERQIAAERTAHDEQLAAAQKAHEHEVAEQARRYQKEREEIERQLTRDRTAFDRERDAFSKERAAITGVPESEFVARKPAWWLRAWDRRPHLDRSVLVPAAVVVFVVLVVVAALKMGRGGTSIASRGPAALVVDSVAGGVAPPMATPVVTANVPSDLTAGIAARADSVASGKEALPEPRRAYFAPVTPAPARSARADSVPRIDTTFTAPRSAARTDSAARRDTLARPLRDSTTRTAPGANGDMLPRKDSTSVTRR